MRGVGRRAARPVITRLVQRAAQGEGLAHVTHRRARDRVEEVHVVLDPAREPPGRAAREVAHLVRVRVRVRVGVRVGVSARSPTLPPASLARPDAALIELATLSRVGR
jgi:hypothetical protein